MFKEVMNDLWLARISSLSNEVGLYVVLLEVLLEIMFPIDELRFSEFRTMRNQLSETLMLNDIQITSDYMSRWVVFTIPSYMCWRTLFSL
jgi:hypothetical protein